MGAMLLTSGTVLLLVSGTFLTYELITFRQSMVTNLTTLARVIASNSTAALAFRNPEDAATVLHALEAEPHVVAAGLYDQRGALFASYPAGVDAALPPRPDPIGSRFTASRLVLVAPVANGARRLGTLHLESDLGALYERLVLYGMLMGGALLFSALVAVALADRLQQRIGRPVMSLVETASVVTQRQDYSVRAQRYGDDELGMLTDAFNGMLAQIEGQDRALRAREDRLQLEVTERRRAEAEVHALNSDLERRVDERTRELESANHELEAFSYSVSHDLRAPLRAITGFSHILLKDHLAALPAQAASHLQRVANGAQKMGQLVDDLLAFSRLGRAAFVRRPVEPRDIVDEVLDELADERRDRHVEVTIGSLPPCHADRALLKQVYANLLANALKFTRLRSDACVEIGSERSAAGEVVYLVKDNGAGFDMKYVDKLFGVFQRLHRVEDYEGTGVGLAIVQRVIVRHGGRVWAEGVVGQGAAFYFTIGDKT
jgi:signal transduction histidine kinase